MANVKAGQGKARGNGRNQAAKAPQTGTASAVVEAAKAVPASIAAHASAPAKPPKPVDAVKPAEPVKPAVLNQKAPEPKAAPVEFPAAEPLVKADLAEQLKNEVFLAPQPEAKPTTSQPAQKSAQSESNIPQTSIIQAGAKSMNETINRTQEATKQVAEKATEQFRGAMNDANQRGKVAMEKSARIVEELADLGRGNMEAMVASSKTAAKYVETLTQGAADFNRRSFEEASATLRSFAEVKSPTDFFRLQSEYARSAFDSMVAESARVSETMVKMSGEVAEPITSRYSVAAERLKTVAA